VVGGWVRIQKRTRVRSIGQIFFLTDYSFIVFLNSSSRNAQKRDKKKSRGKTDIETFVEILGNVFDMDFLQTYLYGVF
jgi:hypothetical protein